MNTFQSRRVVVKVGTSTLTYDNGKVNLRNMEKLCKVLSDLHNSGKQIILVSSGAIGVGVLRRCFRGFLSWPQLPLHGCSGAMPRSAEATGSPRSANQSCWR